MDRSLSELRARIERTEAEIGVVGLGYVGLPVAASFAQAGFRVVGIDILVDRVEVINAGESPIEGEEPGLAELISDVTSSGRFRASTDYNTLSDADVVLIDVDTPVDADHRPRFMALRTVCRKLGPILKTGVLVIVESTVAPGTIDNLVRPLLEESSGGDVNVDFYLGACPERVMPGKLLQNLRTMDRVCGGSTPETAETMAALYRHIVGADLDLADPVTAEVVKTAENAYRDVQIAFANEVALICEAVGADVWQVRDLVNKVPYRHMHLPGAGVGGHCIPKDPWLLAYGANGRAPVRLIPEARAVNESMPLHMADLTFEALEKAGVRPREARIAVLGYAYLENSDDSRNSPSESLVNVLQQRGAEVAIHDPWVPAYQGDAYTCAGESDAVVVMVGHREYKALDLTVLRAVVRRPILVDGRHVFDRSDAEAAGFLYLGIGLG